mmetsp:Transcript_41553/g.97235  ORF Transcript_41553/g.97235 Transcript_41553/m.97235 type:complete len:212 (+) Transcript_41553:1149-1784(+)
MATRTSCRARTRDSACGHSPCTPLTPSTRTTTPRRSSASGRRACGASIRPSTAAAPSSRSTSRCRLRCSSSSTVMRRGVRAPTTLRCTCSRSDSMLRSCATRSRWPVPSAGRSSSRLGSASAIGCGLVLTISSTSDACTPARRTAASCPSRARWTICFRQRRGSAPALPTETQLFSQRSAPMGPPLTRRSCSTSAPCSQARNRLLLPGARP